MAEHLAARSAVGEGLRRSRTVKWKVLPRPGSLSSQRWPPINDTSWPEMARPRPVPP